MIPKFSLVIINRNGANFVEKTLKNLKISNAKPNKIVLVDDNSSDDSVNLIKEKFPEITIIENKKNLGPAAARNRGAELINDKYVIFIDNDIFIRKNTFYELIKFAEENDKRAIVGAKIIPKNQEKMWWNMGYDPNDLREMIGYYCGLLLKVFGSTEWIKKLSMRFILNYWNYDKPLMVDWVIETCFLIRKDIFSKVNGFDENFFMFFEGPDLCKRTRKIGFKVFFNHKAKVDALENHVHSRSIRKKLWWQSKKYFYKKHYSFFRRITLPIGTVLNSIFCYLA